MSELFTSGSVGGAAGNCCLYPATRIAMLRLIESGWACGTEFGVEADFAGPQSRDFKR
jgi:hypothetical protein